jgi:hypothetical protein
MPRHEAIKALEIYRRAGQQVLYILTNKITYNLVFFFLIKASLF